MVLERLSWRVTSKLCKFRSLDSCQERFLWTHKEVDLAPHPVVGLVLVLQVGDAEKFPHALGFESLNLFFRVSKQGLCFTAIEEDGGVWAVLIQTFNFKQSTMDRLTEARAGSLGGPLIQSGSATLLRVSS